MREKIIEYIKKAWNGEKCSRLLDITSAIDIQALEVANSIIDKLNEIQDREKYDHIKKVKIYAVDFDHTKERHFGANETRTDQIPLTFDDIPLLVDTLLSPQLVRLGTLRQDTGAGIHFISQLDNGKMICVLIKVKPQKETYKNRTIYKKKLKDGSKNS
ncbi:MAG: hypothetical protein MJ069_04575 [Salinivirgaceae bacterium]|nr:hypothetical protein [Salinivirgaceae bacterium]